MLAMCSAPVSQDRTLRQTPDILNLALPSQQGDRAGADHEASDSDSGEAYEMGMLCLATLKQR